MYQPAFEEIRHAIRLEHPRLLISPEQIPMVRERSKGACKECFEQIRKRTDALPEHPEPEFIDDIVKYQDGKVFFVKNIGDQNAVSYGLKNTGGADAFRCALMYYVTGDKTYAVKAFQYLMLAVKFIQIADRSRILPEWFNAGRLAAIIAYDWLYDALSDEQRRAFIEPMLKHLDSMRNPGYLTNQGNYDSGNYGEPGLRWYFGLAAYQNGICDDAAEKYLLDGWNLNTAMMNFREEKSDGKGLLSSISPEYSFGMYPIATDHFLMTLQSACGFDGTKIWKQPFRFANYFNWMSIPDNTAENGFYQYGWGDTYHIENQFVCAKYIYTHLAAAVHLYGDSDEIRAVIQCLPEKFRNIIYQDEFPWLPFVLTGFDPDKKFHGDVNAVLNSRLAEHFPSYGLTVMRSGIGRNDTYASVKAGASACGHQHYDELSFNIYRSGFQALDTGIRSSTPHHKAYYPQTVAHNSLLIRMENEPIPSYWYPANAPRIDWNKVHCDGGQNAK